MTTESPTASRTAAPAPLELSVGQREALTRYAAQLLEGASVHAAHVVAAAIASVQAREPVTDSERPGTATAGPEQAEIYFSAVRRQALARLRSEGGAQRKSTAEGDDAPTSLAQRVERLTPKQREAVWLTFAQGFGYERLTRITGLSLHHVGFLLHSALTNLRDSTAASDDTRVTDHVLGEMSAAQEETFTEACRGDPALKEAVAKARALVAELRATMGFEAAWTTGTTSKPAPKKIGSRRRALWVSAGALLALGIGAAYWWLWAPQPPPGQVNAGTTEEFRLRPDSWKMTKPLPERTEERTTGNAGSSSVPGVRPAALSEPRRTTSTRSDDPGDQARLPPVNSSAGDGGGSSGSVPSGAGRGPSGKPQSGDSAAPSMAKAAGSSGRDHEIPRAASAVKDRSSGEVSEAAKGGAKDRPLPGGLNRTSVASTGKALPLSSSAAKDPAASAGQSKASEKAGGVTASGTSDAVEKAAGDRVDDGLPATSPLSALKAVIKEKRTPDAGAADVSALLDEYSPMARPAAAETIPELAVGVEAAPAPWAEDRRLVRVVLTAAPAREARPAAAHVVLLVDVSASMDAPNRLPLVVASARRLLRGLAPADRVSIVTYAGEARVALPPTTLEHASEIQAALTALKPEGMTNGGAGLRRAYALAHAGFVPGGVNRVLLCTDGDFNMGITSEGELTALVASEAKAGIELGVFGFGRGRQIDPRLEALATAGQGGSGNVTTRRDAERRMAAEVNGWSPTRVRDLSVILECDPRRVAAWRLIGYEENFLPPEALGRRGFEQSELPPGESVTVLFELRSAEGTSTRDVADAAAAVIACVRYRDGNGTAHVIRAPLGDSVARLSEASAEFRFTASVADLGLALRVSPLPHARLDGVVRRAESAAADLAERDYGGYREEFLSLAREARELAK